MVAYVVGRRQAVATLTAAHVQIDGNRKQWRDDSRRPAWLAFMRSADRLNDSVDRLLRGQVEPSVILEEFLPDAGRKLKEVELEGPSEIYDIAKKFSSSVNGRLVGAAIVGPFISAQGKFDYLLAEARRDVLLQGADSEQAACVIRAHEALQRLAAERRRIGQTDPSVELTQLSDAICAPMVQSVSSVDSGVGESISLLLQGLGGVVVAIYSDVPMEAADAVSKVQECDAFSERDATSLLFTFGTGFLPVLQRLLNDQIEPTRQLRRDFLNATDRYLDGRLPVPRGE
ncbi:hypothetical protein [Streptomyces lydicamycinicus]|uniref:Uncharacterized protein n=1 Tax=Streptomyces lydicamycinicus TaxID=1546107 RepID=A0A0P4R6D3_9ACTN|nr:hypothetical protein [Streptomyces lydicamycinicus]GAO08447.1 hypothetical protein TPA0598_04_00830 [Streptomyces lydicamycinicus]